ncbi:hypothetical protein Tsubulata_011251 [Turnera subulata]|uniref:Germin-like protein n=1 Tax=Turnera subulata TaxID=218843 RepID=A0A9Q0FYR5_9ROSI|nr:hypothetical protein Tsubulata_011251 [Turnera subulata]
MRGVIVLAASLLLALVSSLVSAYDPSPLQDFCAATNDTKHAEFVNGKFCKRRDITTADDFFYTGLNLPTNTSSSPLGSNANLLDVSKIPGLNTLGISLVRADLAANGGLIQLHTHPRATEIILVLEGTLYAGFVTSFPENRLIAKVLNAGDVFVIPMGLIHFQFNIGKTNAVVIAAFNSENPGVISIPNAVFGANPAINPDILAKAFQLDKKIVEDLETKF